ncbi:hypothetical protein KQ717_15830, partial [Listeria monocytogenes]|nr:hypothetical protein [Listeria monocytogenes]
PPAVPDGSAVLAPWHQLVAAGRLPTGAPFLAGTAPRPVARVAAATAAAAAGANGGALTVATEAGSITLPVLVTDMPD